MNAGEFRVSESAGGDAALGAVAAGREVGTPTPPTPRGYTRGVVKRCQVLVIGGGPAGATAAALLAQQGARVCLLERARFPRPHVGESLQPASFKLLEHHFGLGAQVAAQGFARKYGAVYVWGRDREPWSVLFDERLERDLPTLDEQGLLTGDYLRAWQVDRAVFDSLLLDNAAAQGAEVLQRWEATAPLMEGGRVVGARVRRLEDGQEQDIRADIVLDASGQRCLLGRSLGLTRAVTDLRSTATYTYLEGAGGVPGPLGRHVQLVVSVPGGWVWFIPVSANRTSVGVVTDARRRLEPHEFQQALDAAELPITGCALEQPLRFARDWSFTHKAFAGPGWMLMGDAACFVDPVLSGGVDFAIRGAFNAAVGALKILGGEPEGPIGQSYDQGLRTEYRAYLSMARYWYANNASVEGLFWRAHQAVPKGSAATPLRAFVYLTTGQYAADRHFKIFQGWQEQNMFKALGVNKAALQASRREL